MEWLKKIGNVPVLHSYYLVGDIGNNLLNGSLNINTYPYIDNIGVATIRQNALVLKPSEWTQDEVFLNIPVYSTENASLNTELNYIINKRGDTIADMYTEANSVLGVSRQNTYIYAYSEQANALVYVFAIALYGGDANVLKGYWICGAVNTSNPDVMNYMPAGGSVATVINLQVLHNLNYDIPLDEESADFGPSSQPNGYGKPSDHSGSHHTRVPGGKPSYNYKSEKIGIPTMPTIGCTTAGFYHAYKVSQGTLNDFGAKLFPTIGQLAGQIAPFNSVEEALAYFAGMIFCPGVVSGATIPNQVISLADILMNGKSIDYVVDCHVIPVSPSTGASQNIKCGARTLDISAPVITSDYIDFDCGAVSVPLTFANFLDFTCRGRLFLPFVGFVDLKPEFWHGGSVFVKYRFNIVDGSFMAYVICNNSATSEIYQTVVGQFGGAACLHIPVTGVNYSSMVSGMVSGSMSLVAGAASGNAVGAVGGALTLANMQPSVASSNNYNSSTAFLGVRRPYLMIERPVPSTSTKYAHSKGLPLNVAMPIGSVHGYTEIEDVDLSGLDYTQEEIEELRGLLAGGVYL